MKIVKRAYVAFIEKRPPSEGIKTIIHLHGSLIDEPLALSFFVDPDNPPFKVGDIVTVTMETEE